MPRCGITRLSGFRWGVRVRLLQFSETRAARGCRNKPCYQSAVAPGEHITALRAEAVDVAAGDSNRSSEFAGLPFEPTPDSERERRDRDDDDQIDAEDR